MAVGGDVDVEAGRERGRVDGGHPPHLEAVHRRGLAVGAGLGDAGPGDLDGGDRRLARRRRPDLIDDRVGDRALVARQHEVGPDAAGDGRRHRRLQAVGDHGGERHQADADHEGRRGGRRAPGRAGGVALAEAAGQTETGPGAHRQRHARHHQHERGRPVQAGDGSAAATPATATPTPTAASTTANRRAADDPGQRAHQHHAEGGHADETDEGAQPEQRQPIAAVADDGGGDGRRRRPRWRSRRARCARRDGGSSGRRHR